MLPLSGKLYRFTYRYLQDKDDAKDAVQEVFIKLWNLRDQIQELQNVEAFAVRVARNHCLDVIKKHRTVSMDASHTYTNSYSHSEDPSVIMSRDESVKVLKEIIHRLPEPQRSVILFRDVEGYESDEVCDMLNINDGNLRVILSRARKRVREEFEKIYSHGNTRIQNIVAEVL